jgi:uncharacterized protein YecA (UPF0149 family)
MNSYAQFAILGAMMMSYEPYGLLSNHIPSRGRAGTYIRESEKIGRNEPCPCGSKKKYKKCCIA